jgi:maleate cis-trans isomerase
VSFGAQESRTGVSSTDWTGSQAILLACSNFRTLEIIEMLEGKLGKPVITSHMSSLWKITGTYREQGVYSAKRNSRRRRYRQ